MKLAQALKKFDFVKRLKIPDLKAIPVLISNLTLILSGSEKKHLTPFATAFPPPGLAPELVPVSVLVAWDKVFKANSHKMNAPLLEFDLNQKKSFGPRSIAVPWPERKQGLLDSFHCQKEGFEPVFYPFKELPGFLCPISKAEVLSKVRRGTSAGLPFLCKKGKAIDKLMDDYDTYYNRQDFAVLYTRTAEKKKTRNVWGYPFADLIYESYFFFPFLNWMKTKFWQASLVSPKLVDERITAMIIEAIQNGKYLYSVDFIGFDASCRWQLIVKAFDVVKRSFDPLFHKFIDKICERFYTIGIVTPTGLLRGKHGVPSGSNFTNVIDSLIQAGTALSLPFIHECWMMINGDDGLYMMHEDEIPVFENVWKLNCLNLGKEKSLISKVSATFCQRFYHIDYLKDGLIGGIYSTYRAINRLVWLEKHTNLKKIRMTSRDHFGIRTLTILEQCKYHPLFEDLVRFVLEREKFVLDVSDQGIINYTEMLSKGRESDSDELNQSHLFTVTGVKQFESYKLIRKIIETEGLPEIADHEAIANPDLEIYSDIN